MSDQRRLTPRQRQILALYARGMRRTDIARELGIAATTVRKHREDILTNLGVHSIAHAAVLGIARAEIQLDGEVITASASEPESVLQAA